MNNEQRNLLFSTLSFTVSSAGSVLLHIVFAMEVFARSHSAFLTSTFVALQWLPVLVVIIYRSDWDYGTHPKTRWMNLELICAALTLPLLYFIDDFEYLYMMPILFVRGILEQVNRINRTVATRILFSADKAKYYAPFLQTGYHVGIGLAALCGLFIYPALKLQHIVIIDIASYIIAACLMSMTCCTADFPKQGQNLPLTARLRVYSQSLAAQPMLFFYASLLPLSATFFQGTYSVLQPIFPMQGLGAGQKAVSFSYLLATAAIVLGSSTYSTFSKRIQLFEQPLRFAVRLVMMCSILAISFYLLTVSTSNLWLSGICFFLMVYVFEFIWMTGYGGIVAYAPKAQLGAVFGITFCLGCVLASICAALTGQLLDYSQHHFVFTVAVFMSLYAILIFLVWKTLNYLLTPNSQLAELKE